MFIRSAAALLLSLTALSAHATGTLFRTYLSASGSDANPCTVSAPCRLLPAALAQTADKGEVWMVDSANYNTGTVTINQNVSILAVPGALGSLVANNSDAIHIPTASVKVTLRNLLIRNFAGINYGVVVTGANAQLIVEDSEFSGLNEGVFIFNVAANAVVHHSVFRDTSYAIEIDGAGATTIAHGLVDHCTVADSNGEGIYASYATVTVSHTTVTGSQTGVFANSGASILLEDDQITQNTNGVYFNGSGTIQTTGTNNIKFNIHNVSNGSLTSVLHE